MSISILPNNITISYVEIAQEDMPDERMGDRIEATRLLRCAWKDRWQFCQQLLPGVTQTGASDIQLQRPHRYPYRTDLQLYCTSTDIKPWAGNPAAGSPGPHDSGESGKILAWEYAFVHAHYETLQGDADYSLIFHEQFTPTAEFVTVPGYNLFWDASQTQPIDPSAAPGFLLRKIEWIVTRRYAPLSFPALVTTYLGCVNTNIIYSGVYDNLEFAAGTLLYNGLQVEQDRFSDGKPAAKLVMHFTAMNADWNTFPHFTEAGAAAMTFAPIYKSDGNQFIPYDDVALEDLFGW